MPEVTLVPLFTIREEFFDAFLARVRQQRDDCLKHEPGCRHFDVLVSDKRPNQVLLYEIYDDQDAVAKHRTYDHYKSFKAKTDPMVVSVDVGLWDIDPA